MPRFRSLNRFEKNLFLALVKPPNHIILCAADMFGYIVREIFRGISAEKRPHISDD